MMLFILLICLMDNQFKTGQEKGVNDELFFEAKESNNNSGNNRNSSEKENTESCLFMEKENSGIFSMLKDKEIMNKEIQSAPKLTISKSSFEQSSKRIERNKNEDLFENLYQVQNFLADIDVVLICKVSHDGIHLALGGKSKLLTIYKLNTYRDDKASLQSELKLFDENPKFLFKGHTADIVDINWCLETHQLILTASLDKTVRLWNLKSNSAFGIFEHNNIVTSVCFLGSKSHFVSGCLDKVIRLWEVDKKKVVDYTNIQDLVTSISVSPDFASIAVGYHNGKVSIYHCLPKLKYKETFECKNSTGEFSNGRKVTGIEYLNSNELLISTNDSSIRLLNMKESKIYQKYKGLKNTETVIKSYFDFNNSLVISASDDGLVYFWPKESKTQKNHQFSNFKPFLVEADYPLFAFTYDKSIDYQRNFVSSGLFIRNIIIVISIKGYVSVLLDPLFFD